MKWGWRGVASVALVAATACGDTPTGVRDVESAVHEVDVLGGVRSYRLFVPDMPESSGGGLPLVIVYHGATQTASGAELMSWFYPVAEAAGIIVAFHCRSPSSASARTHRKRRCQRRWLLCEVGER